MREIKFRGKRIDNGEWIYGDLIIDEDRYYICLQVNDNIKRDDYEVYMIEVDPNTIGQYTGLHDKNGKEIYEGDIVDIDNNVALTFGVKARGKIQYVGGMFLVSDGKNISIVHSLFILTDTNYNLRGEVIGNIYDNPELLEVQNEQ